MAATPVVTAETLTVEVLEKLLQTPPRSSRVMLITPEVAEHILKTYNINNRPKKPAKITEYAMDMKAGRWMVTGDTIKFSTAQYLRDGQNRLLGCTRSGVPFTSHIVFGIDDRAFLKMDIGKVRSPTDCLNICGVSKAPVVSTAIRWLLMLRSDRVKNRMTFSNEIIVREWEAVYSKPVQGVYLRDSISVGASCQKDKLMAPGLAAALHFTFAQVDRQRADDFFTGVITGLNLTDEKDARVCLRRKLIDMRDDKSSWVVDIFRAAWVILAWNAFATNRRITEKSLAWSKDMPFPKIAGSMLF